MLWTSELWWSLEVFRLTIKIKEEFIQKQNLDFEILPLKKKIQSWMGRKFNNPQEA